MKILSANQIRKADQYTIEHEPIESIQLMERASTRFCEWFVQTYPKKGTVHVFCGTGNNGGDGLAISRLLLSEGWKVHIYVVHLQGRQSDDFKINYLKLNQVHEIKAIESINDCRFVIAKDEKIIDAIFGSGLSREVSGVFADVIAKINESDAEVVSVDIPSGLFADKCTTSDNAVKARHVVTFQLPKLAFFLPENEAFVDNFHVVDIGLHRTFIDSQTTSFFTIEKNDLVTLFGRRPKHAYKNQFGHALIMAGSYGKMGAAVLTSKACLRSGVGLLTVHVPETGYDIMQTSIPEAMVSIDPSPRFIRNLPDLSAFITVGVGPGLDKDTYTAEVLHQLFRTFDKPIVIDADALNILSEHRDLIDLIPKGSVLTPHPGEFKRLIGKWENDFERLELQKTWSQKYGVVIVLKGAYTSVSLPDGSVYFNTSGNPGMATGGSGDVLTGIITGLIAQGLSPEKAALAGVYIHGVAGDLAKVYLNEISMSAGDIISFLPEAFNHVIQ